jgi:hypothetical protein
MARPQPAGPVSGSMSVFGQAGRRLGPLVDGPVDGLEHWDVVRSVADPDREGVGLCALEEVHGVGFVVGADELQEPLAGDDAQILPFRHFLESVRVAAAQDEGRAVLAAHGRPET